MTYRCGKRPFVREETATAALLEIWRKHPNDPVRREMRAYHCDQCDPGRWHLTSIPTGARV